MKQIIEEVLQVEQQVNEALKEARGKAAEIKSSADREVSEKVAAAKEEARQILQKRIEEARRQAERIADEKLKEASTDEDSLVRGRGEVIDGLVEEICRTVVATECDADDQ
jgi:vacuolar-type H+-ATPase subunit H